MRSLKILRRVKNLSQGRLAHLIGYSIQQVKCLEGGHRRLNKKIAMAIQGALFVDADWIMADDGSPIRYLVFKK